MQLAVKYKELSASFSIAGSMMRGFSSSTPPEPSYLNSESSSNGKVRIFALCLTARQRLKLTCWISRFSKARDGRQMVDWIFGCTSKKHDNGDHYCQLQHTHLLCIEHGLEHKPSEFKNVLVTRKRAEELPCNFWNP